MLSLHGGDGPEGGFLGVDAAWHSVYLTSQGILPLDLLVRQELVGLDDIGTSLLVLTDGWQQRHG